MDSTVIKSAQVIGDSNGKADQGKSEQCSIARWWSTSRNAQIKSPFGTKIPRLARRCARDKFPEPLETAHLSTSRSGIQSPVFAGP